MRHLPEVQAHSSEEVWEDSLTRDQQTCTLGRGPHRPDQSLGCMLQFNGSPRKKHHRKQYMPLPQLTKPLGGQNSLPS
jgi:hypothetical protein